MADKFNQKEEYEAFKKLKREQPEFLRRIEGLWKGINTSISDSAKKSEKIASANKSFLGISKTVLSNTQKIHKETVDWADLSESIVAAQKTGNKHLINQYKQMQRIQGMQKRYNNLVNAGANSIQKMTSSLDSTVRDLPIIGNFIADAINFDDLSKSLIGNFRNMMKPVGKDSGASWFDNFRQGLVEGTAGWSFAEWTKQKKGEMKGKGLGWSDVFGTGKHGFARKAMGLRGPQEEAFGKEKENLTWYNRVARKLWNQELFTQMKKKQNGEKLTTQQVRQLRNSQKLRLLGAATVLAFTGMVLNAAKFAFQTGLGVMQVQKLGLELLINRKYVEAMAEEFGTINDINEGTAILLKWQELRFGIQSDQAVKILRIQTAISGQSNAQLISLQKEVAVAARLAGVLPSKVFEDITNNMEFFAKYAVAGGEAVMKTATSAKKLGLNLGVVDQIATHLLDIEGSINAQFEASAVIGRQLNLDRARNLALTGKHTLLLEEIRKQVGGEASFNSLNVVQRDLLSKAIGTDVQNLAKLVTTQKEGVKAVSAQKNQWIAIGGILLGIVGAFVGAIPGLGAISWGKMATGAAIGSGIGMGLGAAFGSKIPSFQGLPPGTGANIRGGAAVAHAGETIVRTESINMNETNRLLTELIRGNTKIARNIEELG